MGGEVNLGVYFGDPATTSLYNFLVNQTRSDYNCEETKKESMQFLNISEAKAKLSSVIERVVKKGEEFLIGRSGKPVAKIIRYEPARENHRLGLFEGKITISKDFDEWPEDLAHIFGIKNL